MTKILLGFEVPSGKAVSIPLHHLVITGMTELSGKTTTIEALIERSGLRAIVFKTKRGEKGFERVGQVLPLYFKERSDWQYVSSLIEATLREKVKFERSWIIRACKGAKTLREVYARVKEFLEKKRLRSLDRSIFTNLQAYLELILPSIEKLEFATKLDIGPGVNVMDLEELYAKPEMQALVIRSVMEYILEFERDIIVVVPECWKFLPQQRGSPVKVFFERFIREGATINNYLWLDSQDIAGVDKTPLRQVDNWILGRQKEAHEVDRTIEALPLPRAEKPKAVEIRRLKVGHFIAACGDQVKRVYVLPAGVPEDVGRKVAMGRLTPEYVRDKYLKIEKEDEDLVYKEKWEKEKQEREESERQYKELLEETDNLGKDVEKLRFQVKDLERLKLELQEAKKLGQDAEKLKDAIISLVLPEISATFKTAGPPGVGISPVRPSEMVVVTEQPSLTVQVSRKQLTLADTDLEGKIAILYAEAELPSDKWFTVTTVNKAFNSHGWPRDPRTSKMLDKFCQWGFLQKHYAGKRPEYRLKMKPEIAREKGLLKIEEKTR